MTEPAKKNPQKTGPQARAEELGLELCDLRQAIQDEYKVVAEEPERDFHFHTGRKLAGLLEYQDSWLESVPESSIDSFAGTGNPFRTGPLEDGDRVVDVGCGAGIDSLIAAGMVAPTGAVIGVDMTPAMLAKARAAGSQAGVRNVEFKEGFAEELPVDDGWASVVISNGVMNLTPDKATTLEEWHRVLEPGGRIQIADILVSREVPEGAKRKIDLWTG